MQIAAEGRVLFWNGGSLWIGLAKSSTRRHSHHAIQVSIALSGQVRIGLGERAGWKAARALVVPSDIDHAFDASGESVANVFCEPESAIGRSISARFGPDEIAEVPESEADEYVHRISSAHRSTLGNRILIDTCRGVLADLAGVSPTAVPPDERIVRALTLINARLDTPFALPEIARAVALSPSRFRHLFAADTGIPFRRYVLWRRLQRALEERVHGCSWVDAAHAAGFADSAHLTRTFQRMFGLSPSALSLEQGEPVHHGVAHPSISLPE